MWSGNSGRLICSIALLCLMWSQCGSAAECGRGSVTVEQRATGRVFEEKAEWDVNFINHCSCFVTDVRVRCPNYHSVFPKETAVFAKSNGTDDVYLLFSGGPIQPNGGFIGLTYVWDRLNFTVYDYAHDCQIVRAK